MVYDEFKEQLQRKEKGWYETCLLWKENHSPLPNNKEEDLHRFTYPVWTLQKKKTFHDYIAVIQELLAEGIFECTPNSVEGREFFIPHKGVVHETTESTELRTVYDASAMVRDGAPSINECLNTGLVLQNQLWSMLI